MYKNNLQDLRSLNLKRHHAVFFGKLCSLKFVPPCFVLFFQSSKQRRHVPSDTQENSCAHLFAALVLLVASQSCFRGAWAANSINKTLLQRIVTHNENYHEVNINNEKEEDLY